MKETPSPTLHLSQIIISKSQQQTRRGIEFQNSLGEGAELSALASENGCTQPLTPSFFGWVIISLIDQDLSLTNLDTFQTPCHQEFICADTMCRFYSDISPQDDIGYTSLLRSIHIPYPCQQQLDFNIQYVILITETGISS